MVIKEIADHLEKFANLSFQEDYDNSGLIIGDTRSECTGILTCLDVTENVVNEAVTKRCNLIVAHHPVIFKGIKKLTGNTYTERIVASAIRNNVAVYAMHTNLDNVVMGVNKKIADQVGLQNCAPLLPTQNGLQKLTTFAPKNIAGEVRQALYNAGAGSIGNYSECSFSVEGTGTFTPGKKSDPYTGERGMTHQEQEVRIELVFPAYLQKLLIQHLKKAHPYEEVAYYISPLENEYNDAGSGLIGLLPQEISEDNFLALVREKFKTSVIRHNALPGKDIKKVALCGGAGSFLINKALAAGADAYITSDVKYHEFFDADGRLLLMDIGHYESEQFTTDLLTEILQQKNLTFAVLKSEINTNPVHYYH